MLFRHPRLRTMRDFRRFGMWWMVAFFLVVVLLLIFTK